MFFAASLAFGLCGKDIAKDFLEKKLMKDRQPDVDGINHL